MGTEEWVKVTLKLPSNRAPVAGIIVSILVMKGASLPNIGSNVIGITADTKLKQSNTISKHQLI